VWKWEDPIHGKSHDFTLEIPCRHPTVTHSNTPESGALCRSVRTDPGPSGLTGGLRMPECRTECRWEGRWRKLLQFAESNKIGEICVICGIILVTLTEMEAPSYRLARRWNEWFVRPDESVTRYGPTRPTP
jgi:hypothetical protein